MSASKDSVSKDDASNDNVSGVSPPRHIAFDGPARIAAGPLHEVAAASRRHLDVHPDARLLIFDSRTSELVEIDLRGSVSDVLARLPPPAAAEPPAVETGAPEPAHRGPGRPRLGVVAREVTLLPRHWDWLARQRGGASVAIRRLVEDARRDGEAQDQLRAAQESAYRFLAAMAGNLPDYEDAIRSLFARDSAGFERLTASWPADIRDHARTLGAAAMPAPADPG